MPSAQENDSSASVMTWDVSQGSHVLGRKSSNTVSHSGDTVPHTALDDAVLCGKDEGVLHR